MKLQQCYEKLGKLSNIFSVFKIGREILVGNTESNSVLRSKVCRFISLEIYHKNQFLFTWVNKVVLPQLQFGGTL